MEVLNPIASVALGERTFEVLRMAIIQGKLAPGEALRDRELAASLQVSRTPVREALHRLESTGLIRSGGRSGWQVSTFTVDDVHEIFQVRTLVEPMGLVQLEKDPNEQAIRRISGFFSGYSHPISANKYPGYFKHDQEFHRAIVQCTNNSRLIRFYEQIEGHIERGRHLLTTTREGRADETLDEHQSVGAAVAEGDFARARENLIKHLRTGEELMMQVLRENERSVQRNNGGATDGAGLDSLGT